MNKIISYLTLRKIIGWLGCLLPFLVVFGTWTKGLKPLLPTISDYYHTNAGDMFTGPLFVCGFFLISYKGYDKIDNIITNTSGVSMLLVALFPTLGVGRSYLLQFLSPEITNALHLISAFITFTSLGVMSYFRFSKAKNKQAGRVHKNCGLIILTCLLLIGLINIIPNNNFLVHELKLLYWLETGILLSFGVSWLLKGKFLIKEKKNG